MLLSELKRNHDFLICIDSDGCLLDNMELKHKECFCPAFINVWELQAASRYAREIWTFVNLYSRTRGTNRFPALVRALDLCAQDSEVTTRAGNISDHEALRKWCSETDNFSESALAGHIEGLGDRASADLLRALQWSREVNANIVHTVRNIGPFPGVRETLQALHKKADLVVVSSTPQEALFRELKNTGILELFDAAAGQESGTKALCIEKAMKQGGYKRNHVMKIGDAPGDLAAAAVNRCLFFPVVPGEESASWRQLREETAESFFDGTYGGAYMECRVKAFLEKLPEERNL